MFSLAEAVSVGERTLETDQGTASMYENGEMATHGVAGSSESVGNTEPQNSLNDDGDATSAGDQKTETPPQLPPSTENPEKISSQAKPRRTSKIKPNPVLRTSRAVRSKTQADTPPVSVESNAAAPSSSETTEIPSAAEVNKTEMSQNSSSNEIREGKVPGAAAGSPENDASTAMETSLEPMTADDGVTPGTSESAGLASVKPATDASVPDPNVGDDSAAAQKEEGRNALHTRKRRFQKAKPNLPTTPRAARSRFQTTQGSTSTPEPEPKSAETDISSPASRQDRGFDSVPSETVLTEKKTEPELVRQLLSSVAASDQITVRTQEATTELGSTEAVEEQINSHMGEKETLPEPAAVTFSGPSAACPINREDPAVCQRGAMESSTTNPVRKGRFQKVRPKPNLVSTSSSVRSNPTTSNPPSTPRSHKATGGQATGPPAITSPVRILEGAASGSGLLPTPDTSSSVTAPQDPIMTEAEQTGVGVEGQVESSVDQSTSQNKDLHVQPQQEAARATHPTQKTVELSEVMDSAARVGPGLAVMSPPDQVSLYPPPGEDLPVTQEGTATTCQTRKGRRLKPNLPQTSRRAQCKPQSAEEPVAATLVEEPLSCDVSASENDQISSAGPVGPPEMAAPSATSELCPPVMDLTLAEDQGKNVGSSECPAKREPQRRQRFAKAKPNLGSSARNVPAKLAPSDTSKASEQRHEEAAVTATPERDTQILLQPPERDSEHSMSTGKSGYSQNDEVTTSDRVATAIHAVAQNQSARTDSDAPPSDDAADVSQVRHPENVSAGTELKSVSVEPSPGVKESSQQASSGWKSGDPHTSETAKATSVTPR